jgi:hypothetical protein
LVFVLSLNGNTVGILSKDIFFIYLWYICFVCLWFICFVCLAFFFSVLKSMSSQDDTATGRSLIEKVGEGSVYSGVWRFFQDARQ